MRGVCHGRYPCLVNTGVGIGVAAFVSCSILVILWTTIGIPPGRHRRIAAIAASMDGATYRWRVKGSLPFGFGPLRGREGWWLHDLRIQHGATRIVFGDLPATSAGVGRAVSFAWVDNGSPLPAVSIRPRQAAMRSLDRIADVDVAFESEEFNRRFLVDTTDVAEAHRVVDARFIDAVMALDENLGVELGRRGLAVFGRGIVPTSQIPQLISSARELVDRLPQSAVRYFAEAGVEGASLFTGATLDRETLRRSPHARRALWAVAALIAFLVVRTILQSLGT